MIENQELTAKVAFDMKATHGIPEDLIREFCREHNITFPDGSFTALLEEHKNISRK